MNAPIASPTTMSSSMQQSSTMSSTQHQSRSSSSSSLSHISPPQPTQRKSSATTDAFLKDFTLVAEAAKRAQMAVLARDMESWGLS